MRSMVFWCLWSVINIVFLGVFIYLLILVIRALRKYISQKSDTSVNTEMQAKTDEKIISKKTLSEVLKESRLACSMTQEYVAEKLHVSRPAVSKWENGASEPSTANLMELAKLYGISMDEILEKSHTNLRHTT